MIPYFGKYGLFPRANPWAKEFYVLKSAGTNQAELSALLSPDNDGDQRLFTTIDEAVGKCVANRGDIIHVLPSHTETLSAAGALTLDVAGITIVGHGNGSLKPTITLDTAATADIAVSADNITVKGLKFDAGFADIETCFEVTTAKNFKVEECEFVESTTDENFLVLVRTSTTDNASDGLGFSKNRVVLVDTADTNVLQLRGDVDGLVVEDNFIKMGVKDNDAIIECATGKDITNAVVLRNNIFRLNTAGDLIIDNDTADNSGVVAYNNIRHADVSGEILIDADGVGLFENRGTATDTASGYILPAIDS